MARSRSQPLPPAPPPPPPLAAELLSRPAAFGAEVVRSGAPAWHYWPAVLVSGLLAGLCYALLLRPGINLAAQTAAGPAGLPPVLTHVTNGLGSLFLTAVGFGVLWGLGRLGAGPGREPGGARAAQIFGASFALFVPLYLLVLALIVLTPAPAWVPDAAAVRQAGGDLLALQRAATVSAAQTPAALALILVSLLGTAAQCALAFPALRAAGGRAAPGALLPLLPALGVQLLGLLPLLLARWGG
ncbi:hypothetical protein SAMN04488058_104121 [Deinococcus reticulitermitis]|uniref:Yip1 domain-containing protein n=1 Tax=Deinococcus reticulitermitis TaxID=856736 RepID=A0A1H6WGK7_9DEIO|nr:hypothetical protein [Deinococcus reticulitermitis]SEJ14334.1 hypothetical protein SAMN04488058_104121 [Deinococcus reticulitermitis]